MKFSNDKTSKRVHLAWIVFLSLGIVVLAGIALLSTNYLATCGEGRCSSNVVLFGGLVGIVFPLLNVLIGGFFLLILVFEAREIIFTDDEITIHYVILQQRSFHVSLLTRFLPVRTIDTGKAEKMNATLCVGGGLFVITERMPDYYGLLQLLQNRARELRAQE